MLRITDDRITVFISPSLQTLLFFCNESHNKLEINSSKILLEIVEVIRPLKALSRADGLILGNRLDIKAYIVSNETSLFSQCLKYYIRDNRQSIQKTSINHDN